MNDPVNDRADAPARLADERAEIESSLRRLVEHLLPKLPDEEGLDPAGRRELSARLRLAGYHAATLWSILGDTLVATGRGERYHRAATPARMGPHPDIAPNLQ